MMMTLSRSGGSRHGSSLDLLSQREREVLAGIMRGLTNKAIGLELGISHRTVEIHRARMMRKLNVKSMAALIALALPQKSKLDRPWPEGS